MRQNRSSCSHVPDFLLNAPEFCKRLLHQIFELVDGLYQRVRAGFGSRREFWGAVRAAFRLFLFRGTKCWRA